MKQHIILAASAFVALSLVSCQKEILSVEGQNGNQDPKQEIETVTFNISVSDLEAGTKAVKHGWEAGDKLNVWLDFRQDFSKPDFVLTYDGSSWQAGSVRQGIEFNLESGFMTTLYEGRNDLSGYRFWDHTPGMLGFQRQDLVIDYYPSYNIPLTVWSTPCEYLYDPDTKVFNANVRNWNYLSDLQVVVTDLPSDKDYSLALSTVGISPDVIFLSYDGQFSAQLDSRGVSSLGVENADGIAFYFHKNAPVTGGTTDVTFTLLSNDNGLSYTYSASVSFKEEGTFQAAKIPFSKFQPTAVNGQDFVDMGEGRRWARKNIFAREPVDAGYFYSWGEVWTKESFTAADYTYTASPSILPPANDAATSNWDAPWRMPTVEDWEWLVENCTWTPYHDANYEVFWYEVTSGINGNTIIIPGVGLKSSSTSSFGLYGLYYWTSMSVENSSGTAYALSWDQLDFRPGRNGDLYIEGIVRSYGLPVRPVCY